MTELQEAKTLLDATTDKAERYDVMCVYIGILEKRVRELENKLFMHQERERAADERHGYPWD